MKIKNYLLGAAVAGSVLFANTALAVDGYKNLKFGMSKQEVLNQNLCTMLEDGIDEQGVETLYCEDLKFGPDITEAAAFFIDGKFLRIAISASLDRAEGLMNGLTQKYGRPSSMSTPAEFDAVDNFPDRAAFVAFDQDTVTIRIDSDADYNQTMFLIYTDRLYEKLLLENQTSAMSSDL